MTLLLDTHALIWWAQNSPKLSRAARSAIDGREEAVLVSPMSAFGLTLKRRIGKLHDVDALLADLTGYLAGETFEVLPLTLAHAELAGSMEWDHPDPFDRLLVAQALIEGCHIVSNEKTFEETGVRRLW